MGRNIGFDPASVVSRNFVEAATGTVLRAGQYVTLDPTQALPDSYQTVSRATISSIQRPGFIVDDANDGTITNRRVSLIPCDRAATLYVWTDQNIVAGDILGPQPQTHSVRRGSIFTAHGFRALESVDRSVTPGPVLCDLIPNLTPAQRLASMLDRQDDFVSFTTAHEGWVAIAASGTVQGPTAGAIGSLGGAVVLTAQAADNASAIIHGQLLGGGFGAVLGRAFYFEAVLQVGVVTSTGFFAGLLDAAATIAATLPIADDGTIVARDLAGFFKAEGGSTVAPVSYGASAAGGPTGVTAPTVTINTDVLFQCLYDGNGALHYWINGTYMGSESLAARVPANDTALVPCFQVKNGSTTAGTMTIKHFRGVQVK